MKAYVECGQLYDIWYFFAVAILPHIEVCFFFSFLYVTLLMKFNERVFIQKLWGHLKKDSVIQHPTWVRKKATRRENKRSIKKLFVLFLVRDFWCYNRASRHAHGYMDNISGFTLYQWQPWNYENQETYDVKFV